MGTKLQDFRLGLGLSLAVALGAAGCVDDPVYFDPTPGAIEVNGPGGMGGAAVSTVGVPVAVETPDQTNERIALATRLGLDPAVVPTVRRDQLDVEVEWTIKNLDPMQDGIAEIFIVGANEFYRYNPMAFVVDPEEDAPPPPLAGGKPIEVAADGVLSGVIHEEEIGEAAQDLDAITRAGALPLRVLLARWPTPDVTSCAALPTGSMGPCAVGGTEFPTGEIPSEAIAAFISIDVTFTADTHMVLEYVLRVRDHSDRLVADPANPAMVPLVPPSTTDYVPAPPPP